MKNFKKIMAMAISVAAVCTSVSAFAELEYSYTDDLTGIATYDATAHTLTITAADAVDDKTVLVLDNGVVDTEAEGDDILYINQYTTSETAYTAMGLKGTALAVGTYAVKVGYTDANGDFAILDGTIVVAEKEEEPQYITVIWGDVDSSGALAGLDAAKIVNVLVGGTEATTYTIGELLPNTEVIWGDVDSSGALAGLDAAKVVNVLVGGTEATTYTIGSEVQIPVVSE